MKKLPLTIFKRLEKCVFVRPSIMDALPHVFVFNAKNLTKLGNTCGNSTNRKDSIPSRVSRLLLCCSPSAILLAVSKIVIFPVNGKANRLFPHVLKEVLKLLPPVTNSNSSSSVGFISIGFRIVTAKHHIFPAKQSSTNNSVDLMTVNKATHPSNFSLKASAGSCMSNNHISVYDRCNGSAFALTYASFKSAFRVLGGATNDF